MSLVGALLALLSLCIFGMATSGVDVPAIIRDEIKTNAEADAVLAEMAKRLAVKWRTDPVGFATHALGLRLTADQAAVMVAVASRRQVSWRAAQKVGKSTLMAAIALWWIFCHPVQPDAPAASVVMTSGNASQVRNILWREVRRLHRNARVPLGGDVRSVPSSGVIFDDGRIIIGITAAEPERLQGYSGPELLFLVDEASGFDDELIEAVLGNMGGGGHVLLCGNPTKPTGIFANTHRNRLEGWALFHSSAYSSPNVLADKELAKIDPPDEIRSAQIEATRIPGMATSPWIQDMINTFGAESAAVAVRVRGDYASESDDAVVPLALTMKATANWDDHVDAKTLPDRLEVGCDPARFGDDETVIVGKRAKHALAAMFCRKLDNVEVAAKVLEYCTANMRPGERPVVRVDVGGLGAGVVDVLRRVTWIDVVAVNAAETSRYPDRFRNTRAELWWCARRWLERGGTMPEDQRRDAELLAARYSHTTAMQVQIESKDEMKRRMGRSPDRADALALACYGESPLQDGERIAPGKVSQPGPRVGPHTMGSGSVDPWAMPVPMKRSGWNSGSG
jgi:phage terminase large subunit